MKQMLSAIVCSWAAAACGGATTQLAAPVSDVPPPQGQHATQEMPTCDADGIEPPAFYVQELRRVASDRANEARTAAAKVLALLGDPLGVQVLREVVAADPSNLFALASLVRAGDAAARVQALSLVTTVDASQVIMIAYGFVDAPDPVVAQRLRETQAMGFTDSFTVAALAAMGDAVAVAEVNRRIDNAPSPAEVIPEAAVALRWGSARARELLHRVLRDPNAGDYSHAASGLGDVPMPADLPSLVKARQHADDPFEQVWLDYAMLRQCPPR
jgi:HEAT repeat protein